MEETPTEKKEKEPEPTFQILTNPARVMKQQVCTDHYPNHPCKSWLVPENHQHIIFGSKTKYMFYITQMITNY